MKEKINAFSLAMMVFIITSSSFWGNGFVYIFKTAGVSSIWAALLGIVIGTIPFLIIVTLFNILPQYDFSEKLQKLYPKFFANILNFFTFITILAICIFLFFRITSFITTVFLDSPSSLIASILVGTFLIYIGTKNIEVVSRFATILGFIAILIFITDLTFLSTYINLENLKPFFNDSFIGVLKSSAVFAIEITGPLFLITTMPKNSITDKEKSNKYLTIAYVFSGIQALTIIFLILSILGIDVTLIFNYPSFSVLKTINLFDFIQNVEDITTILWFIYIIVTCSLCIIYLKRLIKINLKIKSEKALNIGVIIIGLIIILTSIYMFNKTYALNTQNNILISVLLYLIFIVLSLLSIIIYFFKRKKLKKE